MSHHTLSHRESVVLTSSPLRRKSVLNLSTSDASLKQNDDDAERMERRRSAQIEMRQRDVTPPGSNKRKSVGGSVMGLSTAQLAEHYSNCIKLSVENKINAKNAFSLQLIDYMAMMLRKQDTKMDNFQVASCTLDASTKIYAYRVDCVHTAVLKMAGGLAAGSQKKHTDTGGGEEGEDGQDRSGDGVVVRTKKKSCKHKNTVATNVETLNGKIDVQPVIDPILCSTGNMGDCQPGECHFLTSLKILGNCSFALCSDLPYWDSNKQTTSSRQLKGPLPCIPDVVDKEICVAFTQFSFTKWSLDAEEDSNEPAAPFLPSEDEDFAFDVNAVPEPLSAEENNFPVDRFEVSGIDEGMDSEGEDTGAPIACRPVRRTPAAKVVDLRKHLSTAPSEYSYFKAGALDLWAGPSHWKIKPFKGLDQHTNKSASADGVAVAVSCKKQKQKQELVVEFVRGDNSGAFMVERNVQVLKLTKRTMQKAWSVDRNTHPPDIHFDVKSFSWLELRKAAHVNVHPAPYEDDEPSGYDYENDNDTSEYCPNVDLNDELDDGPVNDLLASQQQDVHHSFTVEGSRTNEGFDSLVAPPNKVARIFIPYAMRAKKVDMKKLKHTMWGILTSTDNCEDKNDNRQVERPFSFMNVYNMLPTRLSSKLAENLSAPLAIVALLHLANEKTLHIVGNEDLSDLIITQG